MDSVMTGERPGLGEAEAVGIARELFGVEADAARDLGSERDRSFMVVDSGGAAVAVLKVSNASEDPEVLDMEAGAALWIAETDPELRVAVPRRARDGELRARWGAHWVRCYDALPGRARSEAAGLSDDALVGWGATDARLARALRGYFHPRAQRVLPWDVSHALTARAMIDDVQDPEARAAVVRVLDAFEQRAVPVWPRLRAQALHADLTLDNVLTDDDGHIIGIVDFGDMSHTTLVADLASVLDSVAVGREPDDILRAARLVLDGYQRHTPLEDDELQVLGVAWAARSALTIAISSWRVAQGLEEQAFAERFNAECLAVIEALEAVGWDDVAAQLGAPRDDRPDQSLQQRRAAAFGPAIDPLFYGDDPIQVVSAQGVWITDATGARLLDAYNNVPCVGHAHPRVTTAIARQSARINTHTRYLHPTAIALSERLAATCPPELDTVFLVNSGSEANDLAWRMATAVTGRRGGLCTDFAYHGITEAIAALSPEGWLDGAGPDHVERWLPDGDATKHAQAIQRLQEERGHALAATILDGVITSDRIDDLDAAYVQQLVAQTHAAGGLYIADEVQAGHGRTGDALWSFTRAGVTPDFVTLGKPMGNGHPVAAVITKSSIAQQLVGHSALFSTFGGNPVSAAAAMAVLDVIEDERVLDRVQRTGHALRTALRAIGHPDVLDVRGAGLAIGVELPSEAHAQAARDRMRQAGVLVGTTGRDSNILKIRPPLAFADEHVALVARVLAAAL
ncbi:aminotransferase class III-fold pyridoxal phosphate-dependent enzyme [Conexibacter woesei]|uniref:aminotransferase class III-fold pyridoxal phosphate-dependent enzyme n=1 Tax=Conexibacter woesei TaxID=191495 RepID=UPI000412ECB2|nr:aminotransferase class III-fold pyridoxal phosphate-dependent enzyme [Conexibacter woesei]